MINKELLSKVLDNEVPYQVKVHKIIIKNNSLNYFYNSKDSGGGLFEANEYINIYELAHKCKEWALNQQIDNSPKGNPFKYKVLNNLDIVVCKHSIEEGYISNISPLFYSNNTTLDIFGINLNLDDATIISNTFDSLYFYANTEVEAIFKACQWILDKDSKWH